MPIPNLTNEGFLPEGIHDCTLDEVGARFGKFQVSDRRVRLFGKLCKLVEEERQAGLATGLIIDGSFVTGEPSPNDIDLIVVLPHDFAPEAGEPPFRYNARHQTSLHQRYRFDVFVRIQDSQLYHAQVDFFHGTREGKRKGSLRIAL